MSRTQPKFKIGDLVSVYAQNDTKKIIIPKTMVIDRVWIPAGSMVDVDGEWRVQGKSGWFYELDGCKYVVYEGCLRPWRPDDYENDSEDETIDQELTA